MGEPQRVEIDVASVAPAGASVLVGDLFLPFGGAAPAGAAPGGAGTTLVVCLPGGGMTRRYFDLPEHLPGRWSLARRLRELPGTAVLTLDHLGVGESPPPDDPFTLTPRVIAAVNAHAVAVVVERLAAGTLLDGLGPLAVHRSVGVGHSMGAMLVVFQQARHRSFDAVALLGFGGAGLPEHLDDDERGYAGDYDELELALPALVAARFGRALVPSGTTASSFLNVGASTPGATEVLAHARGVLLALGGLTSMVPGSSDAALAAVDVPVFLGRGEHDIVLEPERMHALLSSAPSITEVVVPGAGHNHVIADEREQLFEALAAWVGAPPDGAAG
jgi:pimeloyl-ACP methyl ester carboxylesterase